MCGGGGGSSGEDPVKYQREQEKLRQKRIEQGKGQLERIFAGLEGNEFQQINPSNLTNLTPQQFQQQAQQVMDKYLTTEQRQGTRTRTKVGGNSDGSTDTRSFTYDYQDLDPRGRQELLDMGFTAQEIDKAGISGALGTPRSRRSPTYRTQYDTGGVGRARAPEQSLQALKDAYMRTIGDPGNYQLVEGVNDPIWKQQQDAYMDYAKPQLEQQFGDAQDQLTFALSRQGQSRGSLSGERRADLNRDYDLRRQEVADKGRGVANQARSDIANQKQSLLQMLTASADPGATATAARSAVSSLQDTPEFSPLGPLFQNATAGLAQGMQGYQNQQQREQLQGIQYGRDPDRGSGRVIR